MFSNTHFALMAVCLTSTLAAETWFDAGISTYRQWPRGGRDFTVESAGTWSGTERAELQLAPAAPTTRLDVFASEDVPLLFTPLAERTLVEGEVVVASKMVFTASEEPPDLQELAKGAITLIERTDQQLEWQVLALDAAGGTNAWQTAVGAIPVVNVEVEVKVCCKTNELGQVCFRYTIDDVALAVAGKEWVRSADDFERVTEVGYVGSGKIAALSATDTFGTVKLTIPALDKMTVAWVKAGGAEVLRNADGSYTVPAAGGVTVRFTPADGYLLDFSQMSFVGAKTDFTLPEEGRPTPSEGAAITINEVMASNETTLRTSGGIAELDWIELKNNTNEDIDLAAEGWKLTDNPEKPAKAKPIEGAAILPANGYLVVFADKDVTNWDEEQDAHVPLGISGSGESVALVNPRGMIISQISFGQQITDVSVGYAADDETSKPVYFTAPTPGAANPASGRAGLTPEVVYSEPHGWKTGPFELTLSCLGLGEDEDPPDIYYTLDGRSPTLQSTKYTGPIMVSKTTVIRAAAVNPDAIRQRDSSATYLYLDELLDNSIDHTPVGFPTDGKYKGYKLRDNVVTSTDPEVQRRIHDGFTNSIRTLSIVIDPANMFNSTTSIYDHAQNDGRAWERMTMLEQINPRDAADGFTVPCGIRIRGAASRDARAKHSFHLFFRSEYGMSNLEFPLFGKDGSDTFDKIDLRTDQNQSYERGNGDETMIHELFSRDCERDFGKTYNRTQYLHLFMNGAYFGMYQYEERCSSSYGEENLGGKEENWQVVRTDHSKRGAYFVDGPGSSESNGTANEATTRNSEFWRITRNEGYKTGTEYESNFMRVLGRDPDGSRNKSYPIYLNITNLIGYCFSSHLTADTDAPCSAGGTVNNLNALRNVVDGEADEDGWLWNRHDAEWTLGWANGGSNSPTYDNTELGKNHNFFNPHGLHCALAENDEYRMIFADQVYRHFVRKGGTMTVEKCTERFVKRMVEIDDAIVCESARWHGSATHSTWTKSCAARLAFISNRVDYLVFNIYRNKNWYPSVDAPTALDANGETVMDGFAFAEGEILAFAHADQGTVYYTLDGSDPRLWGGAKNAKALAYAAPFAPPAGVSQVRARVLSAAGEWSALEEVTVKGASPAGADPKVAVRVAVVMSSSPSGEDADDYLVLTNLAEAAVSLADVKLVAWNAKKKSEADPSITLTFGATASIPAGETLTLTSADFAGGKLTNSDVGIRLYDISDAEPVLFQDCYVSADWWNKRCDGNGGAFVAKEFGAEVKAVTQWRPSPSWAEDALRFYEIEGIPAEGNDGDGEYFVLTNLLRDIEIDLTGIRIVIGKTSDIAEDGDSAAKCIVVPTEGVIAGGSTFRFDRSAYGWNKITDGDLTLKIYDAEGALVQVSSVKQKDFADYKVGKKVLRATAFGRETSTGDWAEAELPAIEPTVESDGFYFYLAGDYLTPQVLAPTGSACRIVLDGATLVGGLQLPAGVECELVCSNDSTLASISGSSASLTVTGPAAVRLEGTDTLVSVSNLIVEAGVFGVRSTGVAVTKTPVVRLTGDVRLKGGELSVDLDAVTENQIYGIFLANKNMNAKFTGGTFTAKVGGTKSAALYVDKGSTDATFEDGVTVSAVLTGPEARLFNIAGNLKLNGGDFTVTAQDAAVDARVFKTDKKITVKGGAYDVNVPTAGSEIFSAETTITIANGTFELIAADDCFNANTNITVSGGLIYAVSTANDVFDSNGDMTLSGGTIMAFAMGAGHEAFDVEPMATEDGGVPHVLYVNGGTIFATGGAGAAWPVCVGGSRTFYSEHRLAVVDYSNRFISLVGGDADNPVISAVKLPAFDGETFGLFATCPGFVQGDVPTIMASTPAKGNCDFHGLYVWNDPPTYQESLRLHTIYGSTTDGTEAAGNVGDVGEYVILTNISERTVALAGLSLLTSEIETDKRLSQDISCSITLTEGVVPAFGSVRLVQSDFVDRGWEKIPNGKIVFGLYNVYGRPVQSGYAAFDLYPQCDGGGAALKAKRFDTDTMLAATTDDWDPVFDPESPAATVIIVVGPDGVTNEENFVSIEDAVTNRPYGSRVEIPVAVAEMQTVKLEPGVKVEFAEAQLFDADHLTLRPPAEWYDVHREGSKAWVELNAVATPEFGAAGDAAGKEPIQVGEGDTGVVALCIVNVKPLLIYGVKASATLGALGAAEPANWTQADGEGRLPDGALTVEKPSPAAGFFSVEVTDDPRVLAE